MIFKLLVYNMKAHIKYGNYKYVM